MKAEARALDASGCLTSGCVPSDSRMKENHPPALCKGRSKSTESVKKKLRSKKGETGKSELALQVQVTTVLKWEKLTSDSFFPCLQNIKCKRSYSKSRLTALVNSLGMSFSSQPGNTYQVKIHEK